MPFHRRRAEIIAFPRAVGEGPEVRREDSQEHGYEAAMVGLRDEHPAAPDELVDDVLAYVFSISEIGRSARRERLRWFLGAGGVAALIVLAVLIVVGVIAMRWSRGRAMLQAAIRALGQRADHPLSEWFPTR